MNIENKNIEKIDKLRGSVIKDLEDIIDNRYIYTVDNIVDKLKIQRVYIQKEFISNMKTFHLNRVFKLYCKSCLNDSKAYKALSYELNLFLSHEEFICLNMDVIDMIKKAQLDKYKLSRRILISEFQLIAAIKNKFMIEIESIENGEYSQEYLRISDEHAEIIMAAGLKDQSDLKEYYGVKTELQVYRRLRKNSTCVFAKYVIPSESDTKKGLARYLTVYDFPYPLMTKAMEIFYGTNKND